MVLVTCGSPIEMTWVLTSWLPNRVDGRRQALGSEHHTPRQPFNCFSPELSLVQRGMWSIVNILVYNARVPRDATRQQGNSAADRLNSTSCHGE